ncbi:beta-lactamase family protein [bacterium]|nr:beta-lactamase family protein [bacterium]
MREFIRPILILFVLLLAALFAGCANDHDDGGTTSPQSLEQELQQIVSSSISPSADVHSAVVEVEDPARDFSWRGAAGFANPQTSERMTINHRFRIASVTKPMTAVLILRLTEEGVLDLDHTAWAYLGDSSGVNFDSLMIYQGTSYGRAITLKRLLRHTSGLPDYVFDGPTNIYGLTDFLSYALSHPDKQWEPYEMVQWSYRHLAAVGVPGQRYHYSDTGYVLLGMVAEQVTGQELPDLYRQYIFDPLGMDVSYLEFHESPVAGGALSHAYFDQLDAMSYNTSFDWAGGGVVSSAEDITRFIRAVAEGSIFTNPGSHDIMFDWMDIGTGEFYGLGIEKRVTSLGEFVGHPGVYGSFAYYWMNRGITCTGTMNQLTADVEGFLLDIMYVMD